MGRFLLFLLLLVCVQSFGLDTSPEGIYRATYGACTKVTLADLSGLKSDKLRAGYFPNREYTELMTYIRNKSVGEVIKRLDLKKTEFSLFLVSHPEFQRALTDCYPHDPRMIQFFESSVRRADISGKIVGIALMVAIFKGQSALFGLIQNWSRVAYAAIQTTQKVAIVGLGASLLTSDTRQIEKTVELSEVLEKTSQDHGDTQSVSSMPMLDSLRQQIAAEKERIKSCNGCPESEQLNRQKKILEALLLKLS